MPAICRRLTDRAEDAAGFEPVSRAVLRPRCDGGTLNTRTRTGASPCPVKPSRRAAARDRSMIRFPIQGPRSRIRTITDRPFRKFVTRTRVPSGRVRCAAIISCSLNGSPHAIRWPWLLLPYQLAVPYCTRWITRRRPGACWARATDASDRIAHSRTALRSFRMPRVRARNKLGLLRVLDCRARRTAPSPAQPSPPSRPLSHRRVGADAKMRGHSARGQLE